MARALWMLVAAIIWTAASGLAAYLYAPTQVAIGLACLGGCLGSFLGGRLGEGKMRLPALYALAFLVALLTLGANHGLRAYDLASDLWGARNAYLVASGLTWFVRAFLLGAVLRASSTRVPMFVVVEGAGLAAVLSHLFVGHREGHVNRPFFLVDPLWSSGYDPLPVFMAIGAVLAVLTITLANSGTRHKGRALRDTVAAVMLIGAIFVFAPIRSLNDLPKPPKMMSESGESEDALDQRYADSEKPDFNDRKRNGQNSPAALVLFEDDYEPPTETFYFRQKAYSDYNGKTLVVDASGVYDRDIPREYPTSPTPTVLDVKNPQLFRKVDLTISMISELPTPLGLVDASEFRPATNPDPDRFRNSYAQSSLAPTVDIFDYLANAPGSPKWDEATGAHYLELPDDPRYKALAAQIASKIPPKMKGSPVLAAAVTKVWLDQQGTYSLRTKHAKAADPVADFLFGDRVGYCVYFANAACFLFRAQGVPSRVVGGYAVPSGNRGTGAALLIGGRYAHAWPEIYVDGLGWMPLDITPEKTLEDPIPPPDESLQQMLGEMARKKGARKLLGEDGPKLNVQALARQGLKGATRALPLALLAFFLGLQGVKLAHRRSALRGKLDRLHVLTYRAVLERLAEVGLIRGVGETRGAFARRVGSRCEAFSALTHLHLEKTLGEGRLATSQERYASLYTQAESEIARGLSTTRKWAAWLDPVSWWRAR